MSRNLIVAHGGGPTPVINASLAGVIQKAKKTEKYDGIYAAIGGIEGFLKEQFIDLTNMSQSKLESLKNTPSSAIGTCRYKVSKNDYKQILKILDKKHIHTFLYNGGNDSMDTCLKISRLTDHVRVIGIPKTIDNDLALTDHSPGFGSAARYAAITTMELGLDIRALPIHVSVIELMGRNAGWITAASSLARRQKGDAPHLIYMPDRPFIENQFLEDVDKAWKEYGGIVVAISEGLKDSQGEPVVKALHESAIDGFGHMIPGNISLYLAGLISSKLGYRARSEKPGLVGRSSYLMTSKTDREEAFVLGEFAVEAALEGKTGFMTGLKRISSDPYRVEPVLLPLDQIANVEQLLPDEYISSDGNDVTEAFIKYAKPLIGGELPDYFNLKK
jgi:ATP-dependent phosphofructokinase / diphosphate-dependent phosphofructokinase